MKTGKKYVLKNNNSTNVYFNYQRYDDLIWIYDVELKPGQIKTIWAREGTYSSALKNLDITIKSESSYPPPPPVIKASCNCKGFKDVSKESWYFTDCSGAYLECLNPEKGCDSPKTYCVDISKPYSGLVDINNNPECLCPSTCDCRVINGLSTGVWSFYDCGGIYNECTTPGECGEPKSYCIDISKPYRGINIGGTAKQCSCESQIEPGPITPAEPA